MIDGLGIGARPFFMSGIFSSQSVMSKSAKRFSDGIMLHLFGLAASRCRQRFRMLYKNFTRVNI